tara:strand:- start:733 stop:1092 length:360 start_codon:yes stop_codon:yes gene_type:complete
MAKLQIPPAVPYYDIGAAIEAIDPEIEYVCQGDTYSTIEWIKGGPIEYADIKAKQLELLTKYESDYAKLSYSRQRDREYPTIADQLDSLYHDLVAGKLDATGEWAKSIKAVKDKYPKGG